MVQLLPGIQGCVICEKQQTEPAVALLWGRLRSSRQQRRGVAPPSAGGAGGGGGGPEEGAGDGTAVGELLQQYYRLEL